MVQKMYDQIMIKYFFGSILEEGKVKQQCARITFLTDLNGAGWFYLLAILKTTLRAHRQGHFTHETLHSDLLKPRSFKLCSISSSLSVEMLINIKRHCPNL